MTKSAPHIRRLLFPFIVKILTHSLLTGKMEVTVDRDEEEVCLPIVTQRGSMELVSQVSSVGAK
ncbi:MAG: hypothetical protein ACK4I8_02685 [Armatimonadota bacterium]